MIQLDIVIQRHRPLPSLIPAHAGFETKISDVVPQIDGFDEIADLTILIGDFDGHRLSDCLGIHCGIGHELFLYVEVVGHGTHQRGQFLAFGRRRIMMAAQLVSSGIQQLDEILHDGSHIIRLRSRRLD